MDKESEERMAPALHTADHEAAGSIIKNLKYSSSLSPHSAVQSETDVFQQYNGVLSSRKDCDDAKSNEYFDSMKFEASNLHIGSSGDFGIMSPYLQDTTASKINSMRLHAGSGDTSRQISKDSKKNKAEETSTVNYQESSSLKKPATMSSILSSVDTAKTTTTTSISNSANATDSIDCFTARVGMDDNSSVTLSSKHDSWTSASMLEAGSITPKILEGKLTSTACPALLVNVDKHESVNPQIIHTTSITTSALAISNLHKPEHEKDTDLAYDNGRTQQHNNSYLKHSIATFSNSSCFLNERTKQTTASLISKPQDTSSAIPKSNKNGFKSYLEKSESSRREQYIPVTNNSDVTLSITSTVSVTTKRAFNSLTLSVSSNSEVHMNEKREKYLANRSCDPCAETAFSTFSSPYLYSQNADDPSISDSDVVKTIAHVTDSSSNNERGVSKSTANVSANNVSNENTFTFSVDLSTSSNSSQACISSVTQTTPMYHHRNSISATGICIQKNESCDNLDRKPVLETKPASSLSLQNVPNLQHLAHGLVSGSQWDQLPANVTNTLQELAASLARSKESKIEATDTQLHQCSKDSQFKLSKSQFVNSPHGNCYNFTLSNRIDVETQQKSQHLDSVKHNSLLDNRILSLQLRLNKLRSAGVSHHCQNHLSSWKSSNTRQAQTDKHSSGVSRHTLLKNGELTKNFSESHSKLDLDHPHLDHTLRKTKPHLDYSTAARDKLGVLKKELNDTRKRVDPYLTESSSDDDDTSGFWNKTPISSDFVNFGRPHPIDRTAAWTWARERLSIAQRWSWLDAQVTGLEFKIKQHRDLHRQLREAKGEIKLGKHNQNDSLPQPSNTQQVTTNERIPATGTSDKTDSFHNVEESKPLSVCKSDDAPDDQSTCARIRPLLRRLPHRRILRSFDVTTLSDKKLKPPSVYSNNIIVRSEQAKVTPYHRADGRSRGIVYSSMRNRAAMHDHSYHKILSTSEDIPISTRLSGHLLTSNKQFAAKLRRSERRSEKKNKRKHKDQKQQEERQQNKVKSRPRSATVVLERADKLLRSISTLQRNTSYEDRTSHHEVKKRKTTASLSEVNKRNRMTSVDSDAESLHNRSDAGTPVFDASASYSNSPQYQAVLKRKRANDQAYDINNIVIPHGLTTARIEKLQYKEILTPGWRTAKPAAIPIDETAPSSEKFEDVSDEVFKCRHDRHEILEKKKYMTFLEMNINKRSGARTMSRANLPLDDPAAFFSSSFRSSPTSLFPPSEFPAPASPEPLSPSVVLRTRRSSSELSLHSNASSSQPAERQRIPESISSDDGNQKLQREASTYECWDARSFPLTQHEVDEMTNDPVVFLKKLPRDVGAEASRVFEPIPGPEESSVPKPRPKPDLSAHKRQRASSHMSTVSRDDERHSDDSVVSSRSLHRVRSNASDVSTAVPEQYPGAHLYSQRKRHKATMKDDFYYYSDMNTSEESVSESDSDQSSSSDSKSLKSSRPREKWVSRPVSRESTPRRSTSGDDHTGDETSPGNKPPLLLKVRKKFVFK